MTTDRKIWTAPVLANRRLSENYFLLRVAASALGPCDPGMFVEVRLPGDGFALPRPFSILNADGGELELLVKTVGRETHRLRDCAPGTGLVVAGPLGNPFPAPAGRLLLVGGGVGLAPLLFFRQRHAEWVTLLAGFRNAAEYTGMAEALPLTDALISTDDGSAGRPGLVTELLEDVLAKRSDEYSAALVCGPEPMMLSAARLLQPLLPTWVSLESYMACGYGVCMGCVVPLRDGTLARACREGPVFDSSLLRDYALKGAE